MTLFFPTLPGQGWSVTRTPTFSTRVVQHVSGREVRSARWARPLTEFEVTFEGLDSSRDYPGLKEQSLQTLMGFYLRCQGQFGTFVYVDPHDNFAGNSVFATGDGVTSLFALSRDVGGVADPSIYVTSLGSVTSNGIAVSSDNYTFSQPNAVAFTSVPSVGVSLAATFSFGWLCRFVTDDVAFEQFMHGLWTVKSLKFKAVRS